MNLLQLCLGSFYIDNYSYQENLLPKYQKECVDKIKIIASLVSFDENGKPCLLEKGSKYINEHSIPVERLDYKKNLGKVGKILRIYEKDLYSLLEEEKPDIIFVHGMQFWDINKVSHYARKHKDVILYVDNHADFSNSARGWVSKNILHKILWKYCAKKINPYVKKFYGVLPARVDFLRNVYGLPKEKIELLVMGADDEKIQEAKAPEIRKEIREKHGIADDDFLIMTGGKIDLFKTQTLLLMEAVNKINNPKVKLIVFGSVVPELKEKIAALCSEKVQYIGWVQAVESYKYFASCDLAVFPGRHSVFWEQVAGQGIPMVVKHWDGTTHIDMDGNVKFLYNDSTDEIIEVLNETFVDIKQMKTVAEEKAYKFKYSDIAKKSIEWQE